MYKYVICQDRATYHWSTHAHSICGWFLTTGWLAVVDGRSLKLLYQIALRVSSIWTFGVFVYKYVICQVREPYYWYTHVQSVCNWFLTSGWLAVVDRRSIKLLCQIALGYSAFILLFLFTISSFFKIVRVLLIYPCAECLWLAFTHW